MRLPAPQLEAIKPSSHCRSIPLVSAVPLRQISFPDFMVKHGQGARIQRNAHSMYRASWDELPASAFSVESRSTVCFRMTSAAPPFFANWYEPPLSITSPPDSPPGPVLGASRTPSTLPAPAWRSSWVCLLTTHPCSAAVSQALAKIATARSSVCGTLHHTLVQGEQLWDEGAVAQRTIGYRSNSLKSGASLAIEYDNLIPLVICPSARGQP